MTALYRMPWYLDLAHRSRGAGYAVHAAALSRLEESGAKVLPAAELHLAFGNLPSFLRQATLSALLHLGLWVEAGDGYEVREAPGDVRPQTRQAPPSTASKDPAAAARARKHRALKKNGVASTRDGAPSERDADRDASRPGPVTERDGGRDASRDAGPNSTSLSLNSQEEEVIKQGEKEERGMQGGAVTRDGDRDVTPPGQRDGDRDAPTVTEPVAATASRPVTEPPSSQTPLPGLDGEAPEDSTAKAKRQRTAAPEMSPEVAEVFEHWRKTLAPRADPLAYRIQAIEAAFKRGLSPDDCKTAIDGCAKSDWNRETGNTGLDLILRPSKTDRFLALGRGEIKPSSGAGMSPRARGQQIVPQPADPGPFQPSFAPMTLDDLRAEKARQKEAAAAKAAGRLP